ncbi:MAG: cysteine desulfurase-like protein [Ardenticatenia bacterium]|jgi:cysteine desulfurase family protein (TIGR01976 family)|nr:MAG: cysteine desulfurase-like protein [Ardenticatenia bacterium]
METQVDRSTLSLPIPDLSPLRAQFPALQQTDAHGRPYVFFDGPGGTQVPQSVVDAMVHYMVCTNANTHGLYETSRRTDQLIEEARHAMADFLNAPSPDEIIFGPNMTTLTFAISRAIARTLRPGDEIVVTRLDHDANIAPWVALEEQGAVIRYVDFHPEDCTLDMASLQDLINQRTRLVAVGYASNAVGTLNDVRTIAEWAHAAGAWLYVDAVHYAPHGPIDVQAVGCDFLVCSAYKFFGPHVGVLWGRYEILDQLKAYKVRPAGDRPPDKFETGTKNHEGIAGVKAAADYLAEIGVLYGADLATQYRHLEGRRRDLKAALWAIRAYERPLLVRLIQGLQSIPGVTLYGITDPTRFDQRVPTVSFRMKGHTPQEIAQKLGDEGIFVWDGNYYAISVTERLGVEQSGGMVRVGIVHYNTIEEVDRFLNALECL